MGDLKDDLLKPGIELRETHISSVFLATRDVWKVKKPVDLGFLDFTTLDHRRQACDAEVRLNRRLAPHVYHGVVPVTIDSHGHHHIGGSGETVDWAVHMARQPDVDRTDVRLREERLNAEQIERVAEHLAQFHQQARHDEKTARYGTAEAIGRNVKENFEQTRATIGEHLSAAEAAEIEAKQGRFLTDNANRFQARIDQGRVRDGHGDLRLEHIYLDDDGKVTIIDCIEFNERFRFADVCADVAFLAMDLAWHHRVELAERLLASYARAANDYDLYPLVDFYESYRAYVRGKIAAILASDCGASARARAAASHEARRYFLLALAAERRPLLSPVVIAVGGVIASGKSTIATGLATDLTAPIVDSDRTRKCLIGVQPEDPVHVPAWQGAYSPAATEAVYAELFRRARAVLESGRPVVLDASFSQRRYRAAARQLAEDHGASFHFVECRAKPATLKKRLRRRAQHPNVSDGRLEIHEDFAARWQPVDELPSRDVHILDTSRPLAASIETLRRQLAIWPADLTQ